MSAEVLMDGAQAEAVLRVLPVTAGRVALSDPEGVMGEGALAWVLRSRNPGLVLDDLASSGEAGLLLGACDLEARLRALDGVLGDEAAIAIWVPNARHSSRTGGWLRDGAARGGGTTREALLAAVKAAGLQVGRLAPLIVNPQAAVEAAKAPAPLGARQELSAQEAHDRVTPAGFVAQTRPRRLAGRPISITAMTLGSKPDAMAIVRMHQPLQVLNTLPEFAVEQVGPRPALRRRADGTKRDLFIWQRPILTRDHDAAIAKIRDTHHRFVVEFDDHPMRWPAIAENDYRTFRDADAVRTSTPGLADILRQWNPNVFVAPNAIARLPENRWRNPDGTWLPHVQAHPSPVRLVFAALNRKEDWQGGGIEAIDTALCEAGSILAEATGQSPEAMIRVDVVFDSEFHRQLRWPTKHLHPLLSYAQYHALLHASHVALLPLADTLFNRCKSDLKFIECAAHGLAMAVSPTVYAPLVGQPEGNRTARAELFRNFGELRSTLRHMLSMAPLTRARMADAAYRYVRDERMLAHTTTAEARAYTDIMEDPSRLAAEWDTRMRRGDRVDEMESMR